MSELSTFLLIILTLIFIGFFAGYEIAFVSANRLSIELKRKQGKSSGQILSGFLDNQAQFIGTCLIGVNISLVAYGLLFDDLLTKIAWNPLHLKSEYLKLIFDTFLSTIFVLVLGEFIPKAIFRAKNDVLLVAFAPVAQFFHSLFQPLASFFVGIAQWILKYIFNVEIKNKNEVFSKIDLEHFFQQTKEQEENNPELNKELFENALSLPSVKVRQFLIPRTEIESVELNDSIEDVKNLFIQSQMSKLVVYSENIDNILGYIHQLDLFKNPATIKALTILWITNQSCLSGN
jgi:CBS domain containing-hemolysin-like protein